MLVALDSSRANDAQDGKRAATAPPPPAATEPPSLLDHPAQLAVFVSSGHVSIANPTPVGAIATESMSPPPCQRTP